ncbi:MAG: NusA-like transcription termination signal-binding factor [Candidatus Aenigmarchaeota archaeon]|nr:NusA-like transcription termination signal-binding factor [Candidatus Aenigmarchaeota archaeon]OYT58333.1 MAG: transcription elongation factor NusA [Candidatus Aenigmarchaeota archaeon ex4484_14]
MKIRLDTEALKKINLFQTITGSDILDMIDTDDQIFFVVTEGDYGLAVGKDGVKIKKAEKIFKKRIKIIEASKDLETFIKNMIPEVKEIIVKDKKIRIKIDIKDRPRVIGKSGKNIKVMKQLLERMFEINDIKIL